MSLRGLELDQFVHQVEPAYFERFFQALLPNSPSDVPWFPPTGFTGALTYVRAD